MVVTLIIVFFFVPITCDEIIQFLKNTKDHCFYYVNGISNKILKITATSIASPLTLLFNTIIKYGIFLIAFKKALVIPLFKVSNKNFIRYRIIGLSL